MQSLTLSLFFALSLFSLAKALPLQAPVVFHQICIPQVLFCKSPQFTPLFCFTFHESRPKTLSLPNSSTATPSSSFSESYSIPTIPNDVLEQVKECEPRICLSSVSSCPARCNGIRLSKDIPFFGMAHNTPLENNSVTESAAFDQTEELQSDEVPLLVDDSFGEK